MNRFLAIVDAISRKSGQAASFLLAVIIIVITYEVIARYAFNAPTIWANELTVQLLGIIYMIGGAYTLFLKGHVSIDVLYGRLQPRNRAILDLVTSLCFFIFCGVLLWLGIGYASASAVIGETSGTPWNPPVYFLKIAIPLGALLILFQGLAKFIRDFTIVVKGR